MLNLFHHLIKSAGYETLKQVQGDKWQKKTFYEAIILEKLQNLSNHQSPEKSINWIAKDSGDIKKGTATAIDILRLRAIL